MKALDTEQVLYIIAYYMHRVNNRVRELDQLCESCGIVMPQPPKSLLYREVYSGRREDAWICSGLQPSAYYRRPLQFSIWYSRKYTRAERMTDHNNEIVSTGHLYDKQSPPRASDFSEYSNEHRLAGLIARCRSSVVPALVDHYESALAWLDRMELSVQRHKEHVRSQFVQGKRYRLIQSTLRRVEDEHATSELLR